MENKVLTISIAAYNVEACLGKALDSIIRAKRIDNIEVLIINDGSKDGTADLGSKYEKMYPSSIKLINKVNGGHGSTINSGIENAHGKYYRSLDADDWVVTENLDYLIEKLETSNIDMVLCNYNECVNDNTILMEDFKGLKDDHAYRLGDVVMSTRWMCYHSLVFKTSILRNHDIRLDEHCFYVDNEYALYPLPYISTVMFFPKPIYCYCIGVEGQSISTNSRMKHIEDSKTVGYNILKFYESIKNDVDMELSQYLKWNVSRICAWHFSSLLYFAPNNKKRAEIAEFDKEIFEKDLDIYKGMLSYFKESKSPYYLPMLIIRGSHYFLYNSYGRLRYLIKRIKLIISKFS